MSDSTPLPSPQVPINRAFLEEFYKNDQPAVFTLKHYLPTLNSLVGSAKIRTPPHKIDANFFEMLRALEIIQFVTLDTDSEISSKASDHSSKSSTCENSASFESSENSENSKDPINQTTETLSNKSLKSPKQVIHLLATKLINDILVFQKYQRESVEESINKILPNDFRSYALQSLKNRKEAAKLAQIENLRNNGTSIDEIYDLLWEQQMDRRKMLVDMGNATGLYKAVLRLVSGVPDVVFSFLKEFNDDNGPLEAIRSKFAPPIYLYTDFIIKIAFYLKTSCQENTQSVKFDIIAEMLTAFEKDVQPAINGMQNLFKKFPLFISLDEANKSNGVILGHQHWVLQNGTNTQITKTVSAGKNSTITVDVLENHDLGWVLTTQSNDIRISVVAVNENDDKSPKSTILLQPQKVDAHKTPFSGYISAKSKKIEFVLDNSYSRWTSKTFSLTYKLRPSVTVTITESSDSSSTPDPDTGELITTNSNTVTKTTSTTTSTTSTTENLE